MYKIKVTKPIYICRQPVKAGTVLTATAEDACLVVFNLRGEFVKADDCELAVMELRRKQELSMASRGTARVY